MATISTPAADIDPIYQLIGPTEDDLAGLTAAERAETIAGAKDLCKEVFKVAFNRIRMRDLYVVRHSFSGSFRVYGPESSQVNAERWAKNRLQGGDVYIGKVYSAGAYETRLDNWEAEWSAGTKADLKCAACGHASWAHEVVNGAGKKVPRPKNATAKCSARCMCDGFRATI